MTHWALAWGTGSAANTDKVVEISPRDRRYDDFITFDLRLLLGITTPDRSMIPEIHPETLTPVVCQPIIVLNLPIDYVEIFAPFGRIVT
jgi:hypothetical protein